jgi:hypothetical protein
MATTYEPGGYTAPKKVGEDTHDLHVSTLRVKTEGELDLTVTGDGSKTVLDLLKGAAQELAALEAPAEPGSEWNEMLRIPANTTSVVLTFGIRTEYSEPQA